MNYKINVERIKAMSNEEKTKIIQEIEETASFNAGQFRGCSQWPLYALQKHLNLENVDIFRSASALAGGVAGNGEFCGALLGSIMAIGLIYGRETLEPMETSVPYAEAMERSNRMCDEFKKEFGSYRCSDVHKLIFGRSFDLRNPEGKKEFFSNPNITKCADVVIKKVARLAAIAILEP